MPKQIGTERLGNHAVHDISCDSSAGSLLPKEKNQNKISETIQSIFHRVVGKLVHFLYKHHFTFAGGAIGAFLAEPLVSSAMLIRSALGSIFGYNFYGINPKNLTPEQARKGRPILLIHGNYHDPTAWKSMMEKFKKKKMGPVFHVTITAGKFNKKDIHIINQRMKDIQELYKKYGQDRITFDFVGHSRGSTMALMSALKENEWEIPSSEIELKELEKRNWWHLEDEQGRIYCKKNPSLREGIGKIIMLGNPLTANQAANVKSKAKDLYEIHGKWDIIVQNRPQRGSVPKGHFLQVDTGHLGLLTSKKVHDQVIEWLRHTY